jgi:hypothetical protein
MFVRVSFNGKFYFVLWQIRRKKDVIETIKR